MKLLFIKPIAISRGLTKAHFNWKTKCKFAMGILNQVLKFDSRDLYHQVCNWRLWLVKYELSCLSLGDQRTWQKHDSLNIISHRTNTGSMYIWWLQFGQQPQRSEPLETPGDLQKPRLVNEPIFLSQFTQFCLCYFKIHHYKCLYIHQITYKNDGGVLIYKKCPSHWKSFWKLLFLILGCMVLSISLCMDLRIHEKSQLSSVYYIYWNTQMETFNRGEGKSALRNTENWCGKEFFLHLGDIFITINMGSPQLVIWNLFHHISGVINSG